MVRGFFGNNEINGFHDELNSDDNDSVESNYKIRHLITSDRTYKFVIGIIVGSFVMLAIKFSIEIFQALKWCRRKIIILYRTWQLRDRNENFFG